MEEGTKENKLKNINNYQKEIANITAHKDELAAKLKLFRAKTTLQEKNYSIIIDNFEYLKPTWAYEEIPEYIENIRQLNILSMEENRMMWKTQENNMIQGMASADEQIASLKEATVKIEKELTEDGE
jgi:hypothetical protein